MSEEKPLFFCKIFKVVERFQTGRFGLPHKRFIVEHPGGVGILPILDDGRIVLIRQFRTAVNQYIWEIPAGTREPGEEPAVTAARELIEETGYRAGRLTPLPSFWSSPGFLTEKIDLFLATDLTPGESALEDGEDLTIQIIDKTTARAWIVSGEIKDGKTLIALLAWMGQIMEN